MYRLILPGVCEYCLGLSDDVLFGLHFVSWFLTKEREEFAVFHTCLSTCVLWLNFSGCVGVRIS